MISFIIPTLLKSSFLLDLLDGLNKEETVGEIILINNAVSPLNLKNNFEKLKVIGPAENLFVNPSWNLGVSHAKYDKIAICNDDILFDFSKLKIIDEFINKKLGVIGVSRAAFDDSALDLPFAFVKSSGRNWGFGTLMFIHKSNYKCIPNDLKIWHGDDYIFYCQKNPNYVIEGFSIQTKMSSTSGLPQFESIKKLDTQIYNKKYKPKGNLKNEIKKRLKAFFVHERN